MILHEGRCQPEKGEKNWDSNLGQNFLLSLFCKDEKHFFVGYLTHWAWVLKFLYAIKGHKVCFHVTLCLARDPRFCASCVACLVAPDDLCMNAFSTKPSRFLCCASCFSHFNCAVPLVFSHFLFFLIIFLHLI